jgi:tetratricopeptide (TPR) repeat protein
VLVCLGLLGFVTWRWRQLSRQAVLRNDEKTPAYLMEMLAEARASAGVRRRVAIRLVPGSMSPALFGLFRPVILLPEALMLRLSRAQLRAVLLHELIHLRRGDVWMNCAQALLQLLYWWHPLVWLANHRIRRVREEAVDDAVMLALRGDGENYAPTLLEVARLALPRPLASLGLVGILESQGALRQRIERVMDFRPPQRTGVAWLSILCGIAFSAVALPMGQAPDRASTSNERPAAEQDSARVSPGNAAAQEKKNQALALIRDGKLLYEAGKLNEAEARFTQALQQDPGEQAAYYYLNLIKETRRNKERRGLRNTSSGRQRIVSKLANLRLETVQFDGATLREAVTTLSSEAKRLDPAGVGINFILNPGSGKDADARSLQDVKIGLVSPLTNVSLADTLDALVKTAEQPIKYSVEDYAIVFSFRTAEAPALYTRLIKVDPNTFEAGLRSALRQPQPDAQDTISLLRQFLASINVDLAPPKSIFWNEREGTIMVRATLQDLDTIETAVLVLNIAPAQLNFKTRFMEMSETEETEFWKRHSGGIQTPSGVRMIQLTDSEARKQLADWESKKAAELLSESSVTTLSGRQCQVQVVDLNTTVLTFTNAPTPHWETNAIPLGPTLDLLPTLSADTLRVDMVTKASLTEFLGYDDPGNGNPPVPRYRIRQLPVTATIWDGATLVIGGGVDEQNQPANKPGDNRKRLVVMVTPTVIDPAGNRKNREADVENARAQSSSAKDLKH